MKKFRDPPPKPGKPAVIDVVAPRCPDCKGAEFKVYRSVPGEGYEPKPQYATCRCCGRKIFLNWT